MRTPLLCLDQLVVELPGRRGPLRVLDGVSLDLAAGEVLGLVGESGAGKSITGAAILGLLEPPARLTEGRVLFDGLPLHTLAPDAMRRLRGRQLAAIFQDAAAALNPLQTVGDMLIETLRAHLPLSPAQARERAVERLAQAGVTAPGERLRQYPHELSGGLRQRVMLALALALEPRLIVADEPTTALDVSLQARVIEHLRDAARLQGVAVLLISHDLGVVAEACDRLAVMYAGRVVEIGPAEAVLHRPAHPYTAGLIAAVPDLQDTRPRLARIPGSMPQPGAWPAGCAFHPRCDRALDRCREESPELALAGWSRVACWQPVAPPPGARP